MLPALDVPASGSQPVRSVDGSVIADHPVGHGRAPNRRQLCHPQASKSAHMVGRAVPLSDSLHAHLSVLAESGRTVVCPHHPAGDSPRLFWECQGTGREDRLLRPALQPHATTFRLDCNSGLNFAENRAALFRYFRDKTLGGKASPRFFSRRSMATGSDGVFGWSRRRGVAPLLSHCEATCRHRHESHPGAAVQQCASSAKGRSAGRGWSLRPPTIVQVPANGFPGQAAGSHVLEERTAASD